MNLPSSPAGLPTRKARLHGFPLAFDRFVHAAGAYGPWVKPVLFADGDPSGLSSPTIPSHEDRDLSPLGVLSKTAFVVDLDDTLGLSFALSLAAHGVAPVPLYNGVSKPHGAVVVPVAGLRRALFDVAERLSSFTFADDAPPAFLLDARRTGRMPSPGWFDNRWVVFPQDFPSATFLKSRGITSVVVVSQRNELAVDLAHVALRWQRAGLSIALVDDKVSRGPRPLDVPRPSYFGSTFARVMVRLGLRENASGGFGGVVPTPSSSSG